jgi:hypothetical protein
VMVVIVIRFMVVAVVMLGTEDQANKKGDR